MAAARHHKLDVNIRGQIYFYNFMLENMYRNAIQLVFESSFLFDNSCVIAHSHEKGMFPKDGGIIASTHWILINEFIPAFYLMYGLYTPGHKVPKAIKKIVDGKVKINMTKRAKAFWEGSFWDEWVMVLPNLNSWLKKYPGDNVEVVEVLTEVED